MRLKAGVRLTDLKPQLIIVLMIIQYVYEQLNDTELVITSIDDSIHHPGSLHPSGFAADIRTNSLPKNLIPKVQQEIKERITEEFDFIFEVDHYHVEWDPK